MGEGKERKMNNRSATDDQVGQVERDETKAFSNRECCKNYLITNLSSQCNTEHLDLPGIK
jgi:hypothetical protein